MLLAVLVIIGKYTDLKKIMYAFFLFVCFNWPKWVLLFYIYIEISNPFRPPPFTRKYLVTEGPTLAGLARPSPPQNCRAIGWWRSPKGTSWAWHLQPQALGTVQLSLRCFVAHHSQCLWSVSSGVTWALEACLRRKLEKGSEGDCT